MTVISVTTLKCQHFGLTLNGKFFLSWIQNGKNEISRFFFENRSNFLVELVNLESLYLFGIDFCDESSRRAKIRMIRKKGWSDVCPYGRPVVWLLGNRKSRNPWKSNPELIFCSDDFLFEPDFSFQNNVFYQNFFLLEFPLRYNFSQKNRRFFAEFANLVRFLRISAKKVPVLDPEEIISDMTRAQWIIPDSHMIIRVTWPLSRDCPRSPVHGFWVSLWSHLTLNSHCRSE